MLPTTLGPTGNFSRARGRRHLIQVKLHAFPRRPEACLTRIVAMNVHQLSIAYVPEHDRILARINTQEGKELQFWLTRRLTLGLSPLLDKVVTEHVARHGGPATSHVASMDALSKKAVAQFQRSETLKNADFATPYKPSEASEPLFDQPLLVTEVNIAPLNNGQLRLSCAEKLSGLPAGVAPRSFQMALSQQLIHAFVHLLERAVTQSQWRDAVAGTTVRADPLQDPSNAPDKPGYLN